MKAFECPAEFEKLLKESSVIELIGLLNDLWRFPEDAAYLNAVHKEMKQRAADQLTGKV